MADAAQLKNCHATASYAPSNPSHFSFVRYFSVSERGLANLGVVISKKYYSGAHPSPIPRHQFWSHWGAAMIKRLCFCIIIYIFLVILNSFNVLTLKIKNNLENIILIYKKQHSTRQPFENYHHLLLYATR
jgi:hypothetical protein